MFALPHDLYKDKYIILSLLTTPNNETVEHCKSNETVLYIVKK